MRTVTVTRTLSKLLHEPMFEITYKTQIVPWVQPPFGTVDVIALIRKDMRELGFTHVLFTGDWNDTPKPKNQPL